MKEKMLHCELKLINRFLMIKLWLNIIISNQSCRIKYFKRKYTWDSKKNLLFICAIIYFNEFKMFIDIIIYTSKKTNSLNGGKIKVQNIHIPKLIRYGRINVDKIFINMFLNYL
jgi:hypothetical protein